MQGNSPFLRILATLTPRQFKRFGQFLESPFSLPYRQPLELFRYLENRFSKWHPQLHANRNQLVDFEQTHPQAFINFTKSRISEVLFPGEPENDPRMRRVISLTKKALEKFLLIDAISNAKVPFHSQSALLRRFLNQGDKVCLEAYGKQFQKENQKSQRQDEPEISLYHFRNAIAQTEASMRSQKFAKTDFQTANDHLDRFYIQQKLRLNAAMHALEPLGDPHDYNYSLEAELTEFLHQNDFLKSPLIKLYRLATQLIQNDAAPHLLPEAIEILNENAAQISDYDFRQLTGFFLAYLDQRKLILGIPIRKKIFRLAKALIERKVIYINQRIVFPWLSRIVFAALHVNELEWLEDFLFAHEGKLSGDSTEQLWELSMLLYTFEMKEFQIVLQKINSAQFKNVRLAILARILIAKSLFELAEKTDDPDERYEYITKLNKALTASLSYVRSRQGLNEKSTAGNLETLKLVEKMTKLAFYQEGNSELLLEEIETAQISPFEKKWILRKFHSNT